MEEPGLIFWSTLSFTATIGEKHLGMDMWDGPCQVLVPGEAKLILQQVGYITDNPSLLSCRKKYKHLEIFQGLCLEERVGNVVIH